MIRALYRALLLWPFRALLAFLYVGGIMPAPLYLHWLYWAREDMAADHPDLPELLIEISELEEICRA